MKKTILLFLLAPIINYAQNFGWFKQFKNDGGITAIYNHGASVNHNNEIVSCGLITSGLASGIGEDFDPGSATHDVFPIGTAAYNIWVSKLDSNGNYMWLSNFAVNNDGVGQVFAKQNGAGEVFVAGRFNQTADFDPGTGTYTMTSVAISAGDNGFYAKLNNDGTFAWAKQLTAIPGQTLFSDIEIDNQGNLFLIGQYQSGYFMAKINGSTGNTIWTKKITSSYAKFCALTIDKSANLLVFGYVSSNSPVDVDPSTTGTYTISGLGYFSNCPFILKLDSGGNFLWAKQFNDYSSSSAYNSVNPSVCSDIQADKQNNIYVSGQTRIPMDFDPSSAIDSLTPKNNSTDIYIVSLDSNGNHKWAKMYGGSANDYTTRLLIGNNNDVYIPTEMASYSYDIDFDPGVGTYTVPYSYFGANTNMALNHLTTNGNFLSVSFFVSNYNNDNDIMNGLALTSGGNIIATGEYNVGNSGNYWVDFDPGPGTSNQMGGNIFILKLLSDATSGIVINQEAISSFQIYPNPAQKNIWISNKTNDKANSKLYIVNMLGEMVYTQMLQQESQEINISFLPAGSYFLKLENINGVVCKKLIKE
ncbi:MAG: T9SS type A sorting domain-containing protein [Bacteroidetes bacterium]|nr:T9SS type A sorting domain-containing protein [Bacteroidota bacterium]